MKVSEILTEPLVVPALSAPDKPGVLGELARHLSLNADVGGIDAATILRGLLDREALGSTGVGEGVAIPHARLPGLPRLLGCVGRSHGGVSFDAIDGRPVHLFVVLLVAQGSTGQHLKALARMARILKSQAFRNRLMLLPDRGAMYRAFLAEDEACAQ